MKVLLVFFIVSLIVPTDVRPFEVKKAGRTVPASRLDEMQKSTSRPESDQMAKLQEQILKRMYEQKLEQKQEGGSELSQDNIVADVMAETEHPTPVPSDELLNDAQGPDALSDEDRQPEEVSSGPSDSEVVPVEEGQMPSSVDTVQEPEALPAIPQAPPLPPASSLDKPKGPIKVKTKDWGEKYAPVAEVYGESSQDREDLRNLREKFIARYFAEREKEKPDYVSITRDITAEMIGYVNKRFDEIVEKIGQAPGSFSVFSLGSLAREEAGIITDLEIGFLTEEKTPEMINYLSRLSQNLADRLFLLGEHPGVGGKGFRLDEEDNSPIHLKFDKRYMSEELREENVMASRKKPSDPLFEESPMEGSSVFIATPMELALTINPKMAAFLSGIKGDYENLKKEIFEEEFDLLSRSGTNKDEAAIRKNIENAINSVFNYSVAEKKVSRGFVRLSRNIIHLYGDQRLFDELMENINRYRSQKALEINDNYTTWRQEIAYKKIVADIASWEKGMPSIVTGVLADKVDLKRDLYRFVEQALTNLGFYHNLGIQNTYDIAEVLVHRGLMDKNFADKIRETINFMVGIRLRKQEKLRCQLSASEGKIPLTLETFEEELQMKINQLNEAKQKVDELRASGNIEDNNFQQKLTDAEMDVKNAEFRLKYQEKRRPGNQDSFLGPEQLNDLKEIYLPIMHELYIRTKSFVDGQKDAFIVNNIFHQAADSGKTEISQDFIVQKQQEIDQLEQLLQEKRRELEAAMRSIESKQAISPKPESLPKELLLNEEKKDSEKSTQLSPFEALERQRQIREEKIRKGESLNLEDEPKIEPGKISQKRLDDLVDTLEYKKEPLPEPGKLKGEQADVKNQLEKIFGKKSEAKPDVSDEVKPLPSVGKVNPTIQKELEKFFASQKKDPKKIQQPVSTEKEKTPKSSSIVKKIEVKPGEIPPPPPLPMPSIKKIPAASPAA